VIIERSLLPPLPKDIHDALVVHHGTGGNPFTPLPVGNHDRFSEIWQKCAISGVFCRLSPLFRRSHGRHPTHLSAGFFLLLEECKNPPPSSDSLGQQNHEKAGESLGRLYING